VTASGPHCFPTLCACLVLALASAAASVRAQESPAASPAREFTADIVSRDGHGAATAVARLYAARGKVRIDPAQPPGDFFLSDREANSTLLVRPARRIYTNARQSTPLTQIFVPVDSTDACRQWRRALDDAAGKPVSDQWRCDALQTATVDGRKVWEFSTVAADASADRRLVDQQLQFPVKVSAADGSSLTLEHIRLAAQPDELFTVPHDYRWFDPRAVVERIKHSDVWVEPPAS
jgi:hypothetical protein